MLAIPVILALAAFIYLRPQEILPQLQKVPFLYLFSLLLPIAWALDVRLRFTKIRTTPLFWPTVFFFAWSAVTTVVKAPMPIAFREIFAAAISFLLFLAASQGVQTFRGIRALSAGILALVLVITSVVVHQAFAPTGCVRQVVAEGGASDALVPDGRPCQKRDECYEGTFDANDTFLCEHIGLAGTTSIMGRVRYRGILQDPNETALVLSMGVPLAFALAARRRSLALLVPIAVAATGLAVVFTKSRSGQLAFIAAMGVYFLRRLRWLGILLAAPLALPVLLLGGRSSNEADASSIERLDAWMEGIMMWRSNPFFGVGRGQFVEHHYLTAHNSFILALAETGTLGLFLWASIVYLAFKITISLTRAAETRDRKEIRDWAAALLASLCALLVSSFFLSFSNHDIFWLQIGLVGALAAAARTHLPTWRIRYGIGEMALVAAGCAFLIGVIFAYARLKV